MQPERPYFRKFSLLQDTFLLYLRKKSVAVHLQLYPSHPARNKVILNMFGKSFRETHRSQIGDWVLPAWIERADVLAKRKMVKSK